MILLALLDPWKMGPIVNPETPMITILRCVICQNSADLIYTALET
jgi:hypothetical protein